MNNLDAIKDWIALCNAKARYCRTLDTKDWDGFRDLFTEDYELDVSDGTGMPVIKGRDAAMASVKSSILTAKTAHQVHTPEITLNGDGAHVVWAMQDRNIWPSGRKLIGFGHYHELYRRVDGEWRIAESRLTRINMELST